MINAILTGILNILIFLINLVTTPLSLLISTFIPDLDTALNSVAQLFELAGTYIGFVVSALGLRSDVVAFLILFWVFKLTAPLAVVAVKSLIRWIKNLKFW